MELVRNGAALINKRLNVIVQWNQIGKFAGNGVAGRLFD